MSVVVIHKWPVSTVRVPCSFSLFVHLIIDNDHVFGKDGSLV